MALFEVFARLLSKDEIYGQDQAREAREVVPAKRVALDEEHGKEREHHKRDDLLNDLQLPQCEGAAELHAADAVGGDLKAVLEEGYTPAEEYDSDDAVALETRLEGYMAIPCQGHKYVRADEQSYCRYTFN